MSEQQLKQGEFHPNYFMIEPALQTYMFCLPELEADWKDQQTKLVHKPLEWFYGNINGGFVAPVFPAIKLTVLNALRLFIGQQSAMANFCPDLWLKKELLIDANRILKAELWVRQLPEIDLDDVFELAPLEPMKDEVLVCR